MEPFTLLERSQTKLEALPDAIGEVAQPFGATPGAIVGVADPVGAT